MLQMVKKKLKNQKGFTLIELLAVIVILGIIAAIAIPAISKIISNTKLDAHAANAKQMVNSAQTAVASTNNLQNGTYYITLGYLENNGYLESVNDPDKTGYKDGGTALLNSTDGAPAAPASYVTVVNGKVTGVVLSNGTAAGNITLTLPHDSVTFSINNIDRNAITVH